MGCVCCRPEIVDFDADVNLFHFSLLKVVGRGAFGKVRVVQHKQSREIYAMKYINKGKCVKMKAVSNMIQERRLLEEIDHPFVVNLRYAFQDDENCILVLDLMLGGDLRFHLERLGSLPEASVKFYMAQLSSAVKYLHRNHIMHRDIKPDNILLDAEGNAHLSDFNIAVHFTDRRLLTGVAGSMAYMAPEVFNKRGYTCFVDWWSLGVCAYEFIYGRRPFRGRSNGDLTHAISKDPLKFPEDENTKCSTEARSAIRMWLDRDPPKRLGHRPANPGDSSEHDQVHAWFHDISHADLEAKQLTPPFVPDSRRPNFDASHELEELLLEDNPLKAKARKANPENLSSEMKHIEEQFTIYDFKRMQRRSYYPNNIQPASITTMADPAIQMPMSDMETAG